MAKVLKSAEGTTTVQDAQGNVIYPCGYRGGAKVRVAAPVEFEEADVSLSSQAGIAQIERDRAVQLADATRCLNLSSMLSEEGWDHVKKMAGPGYEVDKTGVLTPLEPESEGSTVNKGPGFFAQPFALAAGMGTEGILGDESQLLCEDDVAMICKQVEDDQKEVKNACFQYLAQFFKSMDEEGKGVLVGDAFKTAIGKLEEDMPMEAKEAPWMTPRAAKLIEEAGAEGTIDYNKFLMEELESPRDDAL